MDENSIESRYLASMQEQIKDKNKIILLLEQGKVKTNSFRVPRDKDKTIFDNYKAPASRKIGKYSLDEEAILRYMEDKYSIKDIGKKLNRDWISVGAKLSNMRLGKQKRKMTL